MISGYWISGLMFGFEWDLDEKWWSLNLGIVRFIYDWDEVHV